MKMDKNEKTQALHLYTNMVTDLIRFHLLNKEDSGNMETFINKFNEKCIKDSLFDIFTEYRKDKRRFRYIVSGRETISESMFNGFVYTSFCYDSSLTSIIEDVKEYIYEFTKCFYIIHPKTHKKILFSSNELIQDYFNKVKTFSSLKTKTIFKSFMEEVFMNKYKAILLKENLLLQKDDKLKKDIEDIIKTLVDRYLDNSVYNLILTNKKEEIVELLDNNYLLKNRPLCKSISEIINLKSSNRIKIEIGVNQYITALDLIDLFKDSYKNSYSRHLLLPPSLIKEDNGSYNFKLDVYYNNNSNIDKHTKGLLSKHINKVLRHLTKPFSFRDSELIVPYWVDNRVEFRLLELSDKTDIKKHIFSYERFSSLLKSDNISLEDKDYLKLCLLGIDILIDKLKLNSVPEYSKIKFLICTLNSNNIYYNIKSQLERIYKLTYGFLDDGLSFESENLNTLVDQIRLTNRVKGTFSILDCPLIENNEFNTEKEVFESNMNEETENSNEVCETISELDKVIEDNINEEELDLFKDKPEPKLVKKTLFQKIIDIFK